MTPRWAQKLEAQARPTQTAGDQVQLFRLVMAAAAICIPIGLTGAKAAAWALTRTDADLRVGSVLTALALFVLLGGLLALISRNVGGRAVGVVILPVLTFFGVFTVALLIETFR